MHEPPWLLLREAGCGCGRPRVLSWRSAFAPYPVSAAGAVSSTDLVRCIPGLVVLGVPIEFTGRTREAD